MMKILSVILFALVITGCSNENRPTSNTHYPFTATLSYHPDGACRLILDAVTSNVDESACAVIKQAHKEATKENRIRGIVREELQRYPSWRYAEGTVTITTGTGK